MKALKLLLLFFVGVNARLNDFMRVHLEQGTHKHESVPEVIRGENFTEANLIKYFNVTWVPSAADVVHHHERSLTQVTADDVIAIGKQAWTFMQENKPVVNTNTDFAGAVPSGINDWRSLAGWKNTLRGPITFSWINGFNSETVHIDFKWANTYNGNYNGVGKYVTQAGPSLGKVDVSWGYTVDIDVNAFSPLNIGTTKDPVAQIDVGIQCRASTVLADVSKNYRARFKGTGEIEYL
jgi:hypothetical protein